MTPSDIAVRARALFTRSRFAGGVAAPGVSAAPYPPQSITLDLGGTENVSGLLYLPRQVTFPPVRARYVSAAEINVIGSPAS